MEKVNMYFVKYICSFTIKNSDGSTIKKATIEDSLIVELNTRTKSAEELTIDIKSFASSHATYGNNKPEWTIYPETVILNMVKL